MIVYDKLKIRESLNSDHIFDLLQEFGGDPISTPFGFTSSTICHNMPGEGSRKLYYYNNTDLFQCYTGCAESSFDIFQLVIKVFQIQKHIDFDLNDAIRWVAQKYGLSGEKAENQDDLIDDWKHFVNYERIQDLSLKSNEIVLKEYDESILNRLNYSIKLTPWINEGISQEALNKFKIGFYPGEDQITIPHFDKDNRFIGLRGRTMVAADADAWGKYRPVKINKVWYNHPLGMNLYGLNWSKDNIKTVKKAIIFESEKSVLLYGSYFGIDNNISVACCGSSISSHQIQLLIDAGAEEIIIAFDRQFKNIGDEEFKRLKANLMKLREKYKNIVLISFIFDKNMITNYKSSPIDEGPEKFLQLFKERIVL